MRLANIKRLLTPMPLMILMSAGCQVIASSAGWADFMRVVDIAAKRWGGAFSYALFREQDLGRSLSGSQAGGVTALFVGVIVMIAMGLAIAVFREMIL